MEQQRAKDIIVLLIVLEIFSMKPFIDASSAPFKAYLSYKSSSTATLAFRQMIIYLKWHNVLLIWIMCPIPPVSRHHLFFLKKALKHCRYHKGQKKGKHTHMYIYIYIYIISYHVISYIIKVGFRRCGCTLVVFLSG